MHLTRLIPIVTVAATAAMDDHTPADTLDLLQDSPEVGRDVAFETAELDVFSGALQVRIGVSTVENIRLGDVSTRAVFAGVPGQNPIPSLPQPDREIVEQYISGEWTDATLQLNPGIDIEIGGSTPLGHGFRFEGSVGMTWNSVETFGGTIGTPAYPSTGNVVGGSGNLFQVPLVASVGWGMEFDDLSFLVSGGVGVQWTTLRADGISSAANPERIMSFDSSTANMRFELGLELGYRVTDRFTLGGYLRWSTTSPVDFGSASIDPSDVAVPFPAGSLPPGSTPPPYALQTGDVKADWIRTIAFGFSARIEF